MSEELFYTVKFRLEKLLKPYNIKVRDIILGKDISFYFKDDDNIHYFINYKECSDMTDEELIIKIADITKCDYMRRDIRLDMLLSDDINNIIKDIHKQGFYMSEPNKSEWYKKVNILKDYIYKNKD